jgi:phosphoglycolate phosphatase-like HAD superfamily hydrolase
MIRAWLFDLDGTLISSVKRFHDAYCSALEALDRPEVDEPTFLARYRAGGLVTRLQLHGKAADEFWRRLMEFYLARRDLSSPLPGASEALAELAASGYGLALVTGRASTESEVRAELREHGLDSYFDAVETLGDLSRLHPSPAGAITESLLFARACADLQVEPAAAALVADWPAELDEGLEFGLGLCVGVLTGGYLREDFAQHARVRTVRDLSEFPALLASVDGARPRMGAR